VGWSGASAGEKIATVGKAAVGVGKLAAAGYGAAKVVEKVASPEHSAMAEIERAQAERRRRKQQP
jgi:hypothetical protein